MPLPARTMARGRLVLDLDAHVAVVDGRPLALSHLQFVLLTELVRHQRRLVTTNELLARAARVVPPTDRTITSAISRLRGELAGHPGAPAIEVVRGRGYRLGRTPP